MVPATVSGNRKGPETGGTLRSTLEDDQAPFFNELFTRRCSPRVMKYREGPYAQENISSTVVPFRNGIMLPLRQGMRKTRGIHGAHRLPRAITPSIPTAGRPSPRPCRAPHRKEPSAGLAQAPFALLDKKQIAELEGAGARFPHDLFLLQGREDPLRGVHLPGARTALGYDQGLDPTEYER